MGSKTGIEWTDATWNPIRGCSRVSEGCRNCYAERHVSRFQQAGSPFYGLVNEKGIWNGSIRFVQEHLMDPLKWKKPRRIFVNSMSDLFHENVTNEQIDRIFAVMALCPQHTFQVLTKRPERMQRYMSDTIPHGMGLGHDVITRIADINDVAPTEVRRAWPLPNVWLGVSVENQKAADERVPLLLQTPAAVRFLSCEPLLGQVSLEELPSASGIGRHLDALSNAGVDPGALIPNKIDWVICGGESGPGARPMHPDWARSLRYQCACAGVPFFFKQWGEWKPGAHGGTFSEPPKPFIRIDISGRDVTDLPGLWSASDALFWREGKKAAGAQLDGREWKEFPACS